MTNRIGVALVGYGFWGQKLARVLQETTDANLLAIVETDEKTRSKAIEHSKLSGCKVLDKFSPILFDKDVQAVVIATPASTHEALVHDAILAGKHVFVEKPLTKDANTDLHLHQLAHGRGTTLMVGYVYLHNKYIQRLRQMREADEFGSVVHISCERASFGLIRTDMDALWDMAVHDVSIMCYLAGTPPVKVRAWADPGAVGNKDCPDLGNIDVEFANGAMGHVRVSRVDPERVRRVVLTGTSRMAVFDDLARTAALKVYDRGTQYLRDNHLGPYITSPTAGDARTIPVADGGPEEPLAREMHDFIRCAQHPTTLVNVTDALMAAEVARVMAAADDSIECGGAWMEI